MSNSNIPRPTKEPPMLNSALYYLKCGWNVIPVTQNKKPFLPSWQEYQHRKVTENELHEWWTRWPNAGVAIITGAISGIIVIDIDSKAGLESVEPYIKIGTLIVNTGGGGKHYYFRHPGGIVSNVVRFLPGVDCRGDGGYVIAPPSKHQSGRRYHWEDPETIMTDISPGLLAQIRLGPERLRTEAGDWAADVPRGERDAELTRRAGRLLRKGIPAAECLSIVLAMNIVHCKPPLDEKQVYKIVHSIANREAAKPDNIPGRTTTQFTVLSQKEMLRKYGDDETRWTVPGWLPEASCGLIVAPPGNYKTWLLSALAFSVATNRPFLGHWPVMNGGPVIFIQQEDPWGMLQGRLSRMFNQSVPTDSGEDDSSYELDCRFTQELDNMPIYWYTGRQLNFSDKDILIKMEQKIAEIKPRIVMIDPLYTAADAKDYMAEGAQRMTALKLMRDTYNCSFIIAHHTTVAGGSGTDRSGIWGSQFLNAWLEFGWRLPKGGEENSSTVIRHFKNCESPKNISLRFAISDWNFTVEADENYAKSTEEKIEEAIFNGASSVRTVAEITGCSKSTVQRVMKKIEENEKTKT